MSNVTSISSKSASNQGFSLTPRTFEEVERFAQMVAKSSFCPRDMKDKPGDIVIAMQMGNEVGLQPLQALQNIAVINGRPCIWGDAALGLVRASGLLESYDEGVKDGIGYCTVKRKGQQAQTRTFSLDDAKKAGLLNKTGPWTTYPNRMLPLRARGFAIRDVFPDVLKGLITREEAMDYPTEPEVISHEPVKGQGLNALRDALSISAEHEEAVIEEETSISDTTDLLIQLRDLITETNTSETTINKWLNHFKVESLEELSTEDLSKCINKLKEKMEMP